MVSFESLRFIMNSLMDTIYEREISMYQKSIFYK